MKLSHYPLETQEGYQAIGNWLENALVRVRIRIRVRAAVWVGKKVRLVLGLPGVKGDNLGDPLGDCPVGCRLCGIKPLISM